MASSSKSVRKYLGTYAEPDTRWIARFDRIYEFALVVPVHDEEPRFLDRLMPALRDRDALGIVVVNATVDAPAGVQHANQTLLAALWNALRDPTPLRPRDPTPLRPRDPMPIQPREPTQAAVPDSAHGPARRSSRGRPRLRSPFRGGLGRADLLVLDRSSPPSALPPGQGVGLARKIGADLALALYAAGRLASGWIHTTDADVELPSGYFRAASDDRAVAMVYPFWHAASGDPALDEATALYEVALRSYVLGLRWAGSPYAFHTVGSALAVTAEAYAAVRGFPRRQAGEDFYLLNKLAKLGRIATPMCEPLRISARMSSRVPFGTGPAVDRILDRRARGQEHVLYHQQCFAALRHWLRALTRLSDHGDVVRWQEEIEQIEPAMLREPLLAFAGRQRLRGRASGPGTLEALAALCDQHAAGPPLRRHLHAWFDALRTLKLVHAVRDAGFASLPWRDALRAAPYVDLPPALLGEGSPTQNVLDALRRELARQETLGSTRAL